MSDNGGRWLGSILVYQGEEMPTPEILAALKKTIPNCGPEDFFTVIRKYCPRPTENKNV
jgi:hypothetical protein